MLCGPAFASNRTRNLRTLPGGSVKALRRHCEGVPNAFPALPEHSNASLNIQTRSLTIQTRSLYVSPLYASLPPPQRHARAASVKPFAPRRPRAAPSFPSSAPLSALALIRVNATDVVSSSASPSTYLSRTGCALRTDPSLSLPAHRVRPPPHRPAASPPCCRARRGRAPLS